MAEAELKDTDVERILGQMQAEVTAFEQQKRAIIQVREVINRYIRVKAELPKLEKPIEEAKAVIADIEHKAGVRRRQLGDELAKSEKEVAEARTAHKETIRRLNQQIADKNNALRKAETEAGDKMAVFIKQAEDQENELRRLNNEIDKLKKKFAA